MPDPALNPPVPAPGDAINPVPDPDKTLVAPAKPAGDPSVPSPLPTLPQVAKTALEGQITEREAALEKKLKAVEGQNAGLALENQRLRTPALPRDPAKAKKHWLSGGTFFDEDD